MIQQPNQRAWVALPSQSWKSRDGGVKYTPVAECDKALKRRLEEAVLGAWREKTGERPEPHRPYDFDSAA